MNPDLIEYLNGRSSLGRHPVWMMRQAGRYLASYRAVREKHSFWEMVTTPELAADVSLQPLDVMPLDAVIFFSDILTLPYGMGIPVEMRESIGPYLEKPLTLSDFAFFETYEPQRHTAFVAEALRRIRSAMPANKTLIGFAGAPWTVGSYLAEGKASKQFAALLGALHEKPEFLQSALTSLGQATSKYLLSQVEAGAQMVQLFDTWLGQMPSHFFEKYYLPTLNSIFAPLNARGIPTVYFSKQAHHLLPFFKDLQVSVLSVDHLVSLTELSKHLPDRFAFQGNLDPVVLLKGTPDLVRTKTRELVGEARSLNRRVILNLGHGILPGTPVENVKTFVDEARRSD